MAYRFNVLGPIRVWHGEREIHPGSPQQSAVLASLLLGEGHPVSIDRLISNLWGAVIPPSAPVTIRTYISRLRKVMSDNCSPGIIQSSRRRYFIPSDAGSLDLAEFRSMVHDAHAARKADDPHRAVECLRKALALWQDTPLTAVHGNFVTSAREQLERLRLDALEERFDLDLELGNHVETLPDIVKCTEERPMEERLYGLQMLALYRSARQAEALGVYRNVRELFIRELGIEPGPELGELHQRILLGDPTLRPASPDRAKIGRVVATHAHHEAPAHSHRTTLAQAAPTSGEQERGLLAGRLRAARERGFVGRESERKLFSAALRGAETGFAALFLHGPGGIGKSMLLRQFSDEATRAGRCIVRVEGDVVQNSVPAFLDSACAALHNPDAVLMIDAFERCTALEQWLHQDFLPGLACGTLVVLAGRKPPSPPWRTDPAWAGLLEVRALGELAPSQADALLAARGVPTEVRDPILRCVGGHPLALSLAAEVATSAESATRTWQSTHDAIHVVLSELGDPQPVSHPVDGAGRTCRPLTLKARTRTDETRQNCPAALRAIG
jgi:DNA-binding SARP family transcriptional activator